MLQHRTVTVYVENGPKKKKRKGYNTEPFFLRAVPVVDLDKKRGDGEEEILTRKPANAGLLLRRLGSLTQGLQRPDGPNNSRAPHSAGQVSGQKTTRRM